MIVASTGVFYDKAWDALLRGAGELTWRAGPLLKGPGLAPNDPRIAPVLQEARDIGLACWVISSRSICWVCSGLNESPPCVTEFRQWRRNGRAKCSGADVCSQYSKSQPPIDTVQQQAHIETHDIVIHHDML